MDDRTLLELIALGALLLCSALLTGAEAAYFSLGRARLKELAEEAGKEPGPLAPLLKQPHELLVTLLVGITVVNIAAAAVATAVASTLFGSSGLAVAIAGMILLLTVFGEVLPMTLAVEHPRRFSVWVNRPVAWLSVLLTPVRIRFDYEVARTADGTVVACGHTMHAAVDMAGKPCRLHEQRRSRRRPTGHRPDRRGVRRVRVQPSAPEQRDEHRTHPVRRSRRPHPLRSGRRGGDGQQALPLRRQKPEPIWSLESGVCNLPYGASSTMTATLAPPSTR